MNPLAIAATGLAGLLGPLLGGQPAAPPPPPPPAAPQQALVSTPASVTGTMIMVHGGGWTGPGPKSQRALMTMPGEMLSERNWRIVSVDYHAGAAGLQDVVDAAGAELAQPTGGLLCIYGESAGAQLALVAASRVPGVDCVVAMGPPADFEAYQDEVQRSNDPDRRVIANQMASVWGSTPDERALNDPVKVAQAIAADVLILRQADDPLIPIEQVDNFVAARPTTQHVELEGAPGFDLSQFYLHGTMSDTGRNQYRAAIASFVDRAAASYAAERDASRMGCGGVTRSVTTGGVARVQSALRCLARADGLARRAGAARAKTLSRRVRGEVNAARAWTALRKSTSGRRGLAALAAGRATTAVRSGNPTSVTLRVRRLLRVRA
ncbi:MAG TPA: alpha/beta hydrolase fold domain-containing protein [Solirubrobacteraceae bacterium]|jgi:acetyl esterase/lipase|nr:alpha/beta hydrolase fold domain-containing protein [Solirubrobacteraceae bacterium]